MATVHRCLQIRDTLDNILKYLLDPSDPDFAQNRRNKDLNREEYRNLFHLAQTCKLLSGPALDVLWYFQPELGPLFKCLPGDLVGRPSRPCGKAASDQELLFLLREPREQDLDRFKFYASKIKVLGHCQRSREDTQSIKGFKKKYRHVFPILGRLRAEKGPLLPNLKEITLQLRDFTKLAWYPSLLNGSPCKTLRLTETCNPDDHVVLDKETLSHVWKNIKSSLKNTMPFLTALSLTLHQDDTEFYIAEHCHAMLDPSPGFSGILTVSEHMEALDLLGVPIDVASLSLIVGFGNLTNLAVHLPLGLVEEDLSHSRKGLPNLRQLCLSAANLTIPLNFIRSIRPNNLQTLKVIRRPTAWPPPDPNLHHFLQGLKSMPFAPSLSSISVVQPDHDENMDASVQPVTAETFDILFCFPQLRAIEVALNSSVQLHETALMDIARQWPHLESLELPERTIESIPDISLQHLFKFATLLPHLRFLTLRVNCVMDSALHEEFSGINPSTSLRTLGVCTSPISKVSSVAAFIASQFPNLTYIYHSGWQSIDPDWIPQYQFGMDAVEFRYMHQWEELGHDILGGIFEDRARQLDS